MRLIPRGVPTASILRSHGLVDTNREISIFSSWTLRRVISCSLPMAQDEMKIRAGRPMASTWCSHRRVTGTPRFTPCSPMAPEYNSSRHKESTRSRFGVKQLNNSARGAGLNLRHRTCCKTEEEIVQDERQ